MNQKYINYFIYGIIITMLGMIMNLAVITFNGGQMPVKIHHEYLDSNKHFSFQSNDEVHYWYLSDVIKIKYYYVSIGDILMILGAMSMMITLGGQIHVKRKNN